jgi:hypothetical protein
MDTDSITPMQQGLIREAAWALMPILQPVDQAKLKGFLEQLQQAQPKDTTGNATGVLLTKPPAENPWQNGSNIMLIMSVLVGVLTKLGNEGIISMSKLEIAQMKAKLEMAQQIKSYQEHAGELQAQQMEKDAAIAQTAAVAALTQFVVATVVTAVQFGVQVGKNTKSDEFAAQAKDQRDAILKDPKLDDAQKKDALSKLSFDKDSARGYQEWTRSREEDLRAFNMVTNYLNQSVQSLTGFISKTAEATETSAKAGLKRKEAEFNAAVSMLQSLIETMQKGADNTHQLRDAIVQNLQSIFGLRKEMAQAVTQAFYKG